jgi:Protein of unknown function (DUF3716)
MPVRAASMPPFAADFGPGGVTGTSSGDGASTVIFHAKMGSVTAGSRVIDAPDPDPNPAPAVSSVVSNSAGADFRPGGVTGTSSGNDASTVIFHARTGSVTAGSRVIDAPDPDPAPAVISAVTNFGGASSFMAGSRVGAAGSAGSAAGFISSAGNFGAPAANPGGASSAAGIISSAGNCGAPAANPGGAGSAHVRDARPLILGYSAANSLPNIQSKDGDSDALASHVEQLLPLSSGLLRQLAVMPRLRGIHLRYGRSMLLARTVSHEGALGYTRGEVSDEACTACQRNGGPFLLCVVLEGKMMGACTNCHYASRSTRCSFRK